MKSATTMIAKKDSKCPECTERIDKGSNIKVYNNIWYHNDYCNCWKIIALKKDLLKLSNEMDIRKQESINLKYQLDKQQKVIDEIIMNELGLVQIKSKQKEEEQKEEDWRYPYRVRLYKDSEDYDYVEKVATVTVQKGISDIKRKKNVLLNNNDGDIVEVEDLTELTIWEYNVLVRQLNKYYPDFDIEELEGKYI